MPEFDTTICWLRRDLRLHDHHALSEATHRSRQVVVVFVFDPAILNALTDPADRRVWFIYQSLAQIDQALKSKGSRLVILHGNPEVEIPRLAEKLAADVVFTNHDYEPYALQRDQTVQFNLAKIDKKFLTSKDQVIFEKQEVLSEAGTPLRVFTPYKKQWLKKFSVEDAQPFEVNHARFAPIESLAGLAANPSLVEIGFEQTTTWLNPGFLGAEERLRQFIPKLTQYGELRDFPALDNTSGMSVHLRHGTISIRECVSAALEHPSSGTNKWLSELIWREFYMMILSNFPHVVGHAFRPEYDGIVWPGTELHFEAWKQGQTGYPLVDAAMRCINATGWMHNRLRMVTAMFLTKDLLCDWRWGEAYFAEKLLDFDLAQNNGGWQWSASTGVDAQPYFRIMNPILQSRKFDTEGTFIREWVPELRECNHEDIHWPHDSLFVPNGYPAPIVDHRVQREIAISLFKVG
ncbi:MAG: DNA photolyase family protein [Armatimonadetes bacterium]|nr:DNA photolyase family protein [Armatimonadota bacterium]